MSPYLCSYNYADARAFRFCFVTIVKFKRNRKAPPHERLAFAQDKAVIIEPDMLPDMCVTRVTNGRIRIPNDSANMTPPA